MNGFVREIREKEKGKYFHNRSNKELETRVKPSLQGNKNFTMTPHFAWSKGQSPYDGLQGPK